MSAKVKHFTLEKVLSWRLCNRYDDDKVKELFAGRDSISFEDLLKMKIGFEDKLWAISRMMTPDQRRSVLDKLNFPLRNAEYANGVFDYKDSYKRELNDRFYYRSEYCSSEEHGYSIHMDKKVLRECVEELRR